MSNITDYLINKSKNFAFDKFNVDGSLIIPGKPGPRIENQPSNNISAEKADIREVPDPNRKEYISPLSGPYAMGGEIGKNSLWINIIGTPIISQTAVARSKLGAGQSSIKEKGDQEYRFAFPAPMEIIETVNHAWESYESLASRVAQMAATLNKFGMELPALGAAITETLSRVQNRKNASWSEVGAAIQAGARGLQSEDVSFTRVDMPLVYKNSDRRKYDFTINLIAWQSPLNEILLPVRTLEALSCATMGMTDGGKEAQFSGIMPPCCFTIETDQQENDDGCLIYVENAALTSVQPTYRGPYIKGLPTFCDLHLSFEEIDPLWDLVFMENGGDKVTTSSSGAK